MPAVRTPDERADPSRIGAPVITGTATLSTPKLIGFVVLAWLLPQIVAIFVVPGIAEGGNYETVKGALQLEFIPDLGTALLAFWMIRRLGWLDDVRHERFRAHRWVKIVPIVMIASSVALIDYANLADAGAGWIVLLAIGTFLTGVNEELLFRGLALRAFRSRHREWVAAAFSSIFFGLFHLVNVFTAGPAAIVQAVWAITIGYLLYLCRRVGGGMGLPIAVHAIWDFSSFSPYVLDESALAGGRSFLGFLTGVVLMIVVLVKRRSIPASPPVDGTRAECVPSQVGNDE